MEPSKDSIPSVYSGKSVLITGATGFVGKVLLEKLLRCCKDIKYAYVLIRVNDHRTVLERYETLLRSKIFDRIRTECPDALSKVVPLEGDIKTSSLGLPDERVCSLKKDVAFVFHCAASKDPLATPRDSLMTNVYGTKNVLDLCRHFPKLLGLVYFSMAHAVSDGIVTDEQRYSTSLDPDQVLDSLTWMSEDAINSMCHLRDKPTIYHFTKALAEACVFQYHRTFPVCILRPAIITAAWKDPYPGWVDTLTGLNGLIATVSLGLIRTMHVGSDNHANLVPVDIVVNTAIASSRRLAVDKSDAPMILNCTSPLARPFTWNDFSFCCHQLCEKYPSANAIRDPGLVCTSFSLLYWMMVVCNQFLPAVLHDFATPWSMAMPFTELYCLLMPMMEEMRVYTLGHRAFRAPNMISLGRNMMLEDREMFPVDVSSIEWLGYMEDYFLGVRRYIFHEEESNLLLARLRVSWLRFVRITIQLFLLGFMAVLSKFVTSERYLATLPWTRFK